MTTFSIGFFSLAIYYRLYTTASMLLHSHTVLHKNSYHLLNTSYLSRVQIFASVESCLLSSVLISLIEESDFVRNFSFVRSPSFVEKSMNVWRHITSKYQFHVFWKRFSSRYTFATGDFFPHYYIAMSKICNQNRNMDKDHTPTITSKILI